MDILRQIAVSTQKLTDVFIATQVFSKEFVKEFIIELNTRGQLFDKREDSLGNLLPVYSKLTEVITGGAKKAGESFTLFDTGEFYESFFIQVDSNGDFDIKADTLKADEGIVTDLLDIASPFIIGLTNESKSELAAFITPIIQTLARKTLAGT